MYGVTYYLGFPKEFNIDVSALLEHLKSLRANTTAAGTPVRPAPCVRNACCPKAGQGLARGDKEPCSECNACVRCPLGSFSIVRLTWETASLITTSSAKGLKVASYRPL
jgi:hypothetical protein